MFPTFISILDIQSWWEVPSIAHFCSLFRTSFNLLDFDIEDLEEALLTDGTEESSWLQELIVRLLSGCLPNNEISTFNYQMFLRRLFRQKCQEYDRFNPFNTDIDFQLLPLRTKVDILHALCDFRLDAEDVLDLLKNLEAESLRVEPLGYDSNESAYWYFYGTRLYREDYTSKNNKRKNVWQVICFTEDDWFQLTKKFKKSENKIERQLYHTLSENFLPELPRLFKEKENLARKRVLENQPRRTSDRLRESKCDTTDKDLERIESSVKQEKVRPAEEAQTRQRELEGKSREPRNRRSKSKKDSEEESAAENSDDCEMAGPKNKKYRSRKRKISSSSAASKDDKYSKSSKRSKKHEVVEEKSSTSKPTTVGRQTNNSLSAATGQILIQPMTNTNKKKVKTSQIFRQTEEDLQVGMHKILDYVQNHEDAWPFADPVEEEYAPNYYSVIRKPMDLQRMEERLDSGYYKTFSKFRADFQLIVNNCRLYNGAENEYTEMVDNLLKVFEKATEKYLDQISSSDDEIAVEFTTQDTAKNKTTKTEELTTASRRKPMLAAQTDKKRYRSLSERSLSSSRSDSYESMHSEYEEESVKQKSVVKQKHEKNNKSKKRKLNTVEVKKEKVEVKQEKIDDKKDTEKEKVNSKKEKMERTKGKSDDKKEKMDSTKVKLDNKKENMENKTEKVNSKKENIESKKERADAKKEKAEMKKEKNQGKKSKHEAKKAHSEDKVEKESKSKKSNKKSKKKILKRSRSSTRSFSKSPSRSPPPSDSPPPSWPPSSPDSRIDTLPKKRKFQDFSDSEEVSRKGTQPKYSYFDEYFEDFEDTMHQDKRLKSEESLLSPKPKDKHNKLRETIEKLKAKSEMKLNDFPFELDHPKENRDKNKKIDKDDKNLSKSIEKPPPKTEIEPDSNSTTDSILSESKKTKKPIANSTTPVPKTSSNMDALSIATEQTLKDINKWLDDTPKFAEFSSASNSPSYTGLDEFDALNKLDQIPGKKIEKPLIKKEAGIKDPKKKTFRDPSKFFKRREVQRTIDRLQPGKGKGNLISNVQNPTNKVDEIFPLGTLSKHKDPKNSLIVKTDTNAPKLSLGSVLNSFGKHKFVDDQKKEVETSSEEVPKAEVLETPTIVAQPDDKNKSIITEETKEIKETKPDTESPTEDPSAGGGATPNLSAWFKAFGAPKMPPPVKKPEDKSEPRTVDKLEDNTSKTVDTRKVPVPMSSPNTDSTVVPHGQPIQRQRKISTGSSVSERSSFSQDMDSPRVGMDERGAYPAPYPSPMHRSPSGASPVMASPRPDISPKAAAYPTINGQIRVGFYQDTVSNKSSPDKSCSPRENPQSPYPHYSEHVYTPNTTENSYYSYANSPYYTHAPNYSSTNPTPPYNHEGSTLYYDTSKTLSSTTQNYTANSPLSNQSSPAPHQHSPHSPNIHSPHSPNVHSPHSPNVHSPHSPNIHSPHSPNVHSPHSPNVHSPHSPSVHSPHSPNVNLELSPGGASPNSPGVYSQHSPIILPQNSPSVHSQNSPGLQIQLSPKIHKSPAQHSPSLHSPNLIQQTSASVMQQNSPTVPQQHSPNVVQQNCPNLQAHHPKIQPPHSPNTQFQHSPNVQAQPSSNIQAQLPPSVNTDPPDTFQAQSQEEQNKLSEQLLMQQNSPNAVFPVKKRMYNDNEILQISNHKYQIDPKLSQQIEMRRNAQINQASLEAIQGLEKKDRLDNKPYIQNIPDPKSLNIQTTGEYFDKTSSPNVTHPQASLQTQTQPTNMRQTYPVTSTVPSTFNASFNSDANYSLNVPNARSLGTAQQPKMDLSKYMNMGYTGPDVNYTRSLQFSNSELNFTTAATSTASHKQPHQTSTGSNLGGMSSSDISVRYGDPNMALQQMGYKGVDISNSSANPQQAHSNMETSRHSNARGESVNDRLSQMQDISTVNASRYNTSVDVSRSMANLSHIVDRFANDDRMIAGLQTAASYYTDKGLGTSHLFNKQIPSNAATLPMFSQANMAAMQNYNQNVQSTTTAMFNRQMSELQNSAAAQNDLKVNQQMQVQEKKSKKRKSKPAAASSSEAPPPNAAAAGQGFQSYAGVEPGAISLKTTSVVPGSAFNFGPTAASLGLYADKDGYPNFLDEFRSAPANYYMAAAAAAHHRPTPEGGEKQSRPAHQNSNPQTNPAYPFLGAPQARPSYPLGSPFMPNAQAQLMDTNSPLYQHYLQAGLLGAHGAYPPGYHPALSMRQPYDSMTRPSWL